MKKFSEYTVPTILFCSDASNVACGGMLMMNGQVCHCMWDEVQSKQSSTWRELKAIHFALLSFRESLKEKSVKCRSDNQAAVRIIEIGSPNSELHSISLNWLVPPIYCVTQVIQHLIASKASGTLVVPYWPSSPFWPFLFINAYSCRSYVVDMLVLSSSGVFALGDYKNSVVGAES